MMRRQARSYQRVCWLNVERHLLATETGERRRRTIRQMLAEMRAKL
jgi:hypothetical protein